MSLELDHVVLCVDDLAAAEGVLAGFGLQFGLRAVHHGQGTANACAFFDNAYLELLARHDEAELHSARVRPLALAERLRWRETRASPFGIALRARDGAPAVPTWAYEAGFLPAGQSIPIVTPRDAPDEPLVFLIPPSLPIRLRSPVPHRGKHRRLTRLVAHGPRVSGLPDALARLLDPDVVRIEQAPEHRLDVEWDGETAGDSHDFRPMLPLRLTW